MVGPDMISILCVSGFAFFKTWLSLSINSNAAMLHWLMCQWHMPCHNEKSGVLSEKKNALPEKNRLRLIGWQGRWSVL